MALLPFPRSAALLAASLKKRAGRPRSQGTVAIEPAALGLSASIIDYEHPRLAAGVFA
jgi:hypothetical protein